jgi:hypothetical protein
LLLAGCEAAPSSRSTRCATMWPQSPAASMRANP